MQVFAFDAVPSTMLVAQDMAKTIKNDMFCVLAKTQDAGIGTQGRAWCSPLGNFYATFCFKNYTETLLTKTAIVTGICVVQSLKNCAIDATLKWTNDIIINDKKVGGILCDFSQDVLSVGIGLNFKVNPMNDNKTALLQSDIINENLMIDYSEYAKYLGLRIFENLSLLRNNDFRHFVALWQNYSAFYGRIIDIELPDGTLKTGIDKGIDDKGALILETDKGTEYFYSARITKVI